MTHKIKKTHLLIILAAALCFFLVSALVFSGVAAPLEALCSNIFTDIRSPFLTLIAGGITMLSDPAAIFLLCLLVLLLPKARTTIALPVILSSVGAPLLNWLLKQIFLRERPQLLHLVSETGYSFPSGHSATSAAVGTVFLLLALQKIERPLLKKSVAVLCCILPFFIGLSRLYLGVHHLGDVVAGWLVGIIVGVLSYTAVATPKT